MPLSINLFREDKGGDLATLLKSQKARGAPDSVVNDIIAADKEWRQRQTAPPHSVAMSPAACA